MTKGPVVGDIIYAIFQVLLALLGIFLIGMGFKSKTKPTCSCQDGKTVNGTSCEIYKGNSVLYSLCKQKCKDLNNIKWVSGCTNDSAACIQCITLKGKPDVYIGLGFAVILLPALIFGLVRGLGKYSGTSKFSNHGNPTSSQIAP